MRRLDSRKYNASSILRSLLLFKLFELVVVFLVLSVLYFVLISRVTFYQGEYEQAEVRWTLSMLHSAKRTQLAMKEVYSALGKKEALAQMEKQSRNPMDLLEPRPHNYLGEMCDPNPLEVQSGSWYFDRCNSLLVYVFTHEKFFSREHPKILKINVESLRLLTDPA